MSRFFIAWITSWKFQPAYNDGNKFSGWLWLSYATCFLPPSKQYLYPVSIKTPQRRCRATHCDVGS